MDSLYQEIVNPRAQKLVYQLQQVMSRPVLKVPEEQKLSSAANYTTWKERMHRHLNHVGHGLGSYFLRGQFYVTDLTPEDIESVSKAYEDAVYYLVYPWVSDLLLIKSNHVFGYAFIQYLADACGTSTLSELIGQLETVMTLPSSDKMEAYKKMMILRNDIIPHFLDADRLAAFFFHFWYKNPTASERIFAAPVEDFTLRKVYLELMKSNS